MRLVQVMGGLEIPWQVFLQETQEEGSEKEPEGEVGWYIPLIPALEGGGQKQADLCKPEASPVYIVSSKLARTK